MELGEFDRSGRKTPRPIAGSEYTVDCDMVIEAIGQRPITSFISGNGVKIGRGGTIVAERRTLLTDHPGVFAGGDAVTGPQTVTEAMAAGQRAASSIKRYLQGRALELRIEREDIETFELPPAAEGEPQEKARIAIKELTRAKRSGSFAEVVSGYSADEAREEAARCLRCDTVVGGEE
jgi:NADH-quinone oxidoreductase subunit F